MVAVQIRDVPEETRDALVRLAAARGRSLQAFLLHELEELAQQERRLALLDELEARSLEAARPGPSAVELIQAARDERDQQLARGSRDPAR